MGEKEGRIVFLDYLRVLACLMVVVVHACERYYFNAQGEFAIASAASGAWAVFVDSACRASVPMFVMASAFLLFPLKTQPGAFFRRRLVRVGVPFAVFAVAYTLVYGGRFRELAFNFPMAVAGHLWFVPMLFGLYLLMPLLSPWAERAGAREAKWVLGLWLATTLMPYLRRLCAAWCGEPVFGAVPYLYGECPWNAFGLFHYVGGFFGYVLLGWWFRRFAGVLRTRAALAGAFALWVAGYAIVSLGFWLRIPFDGVLPVVRPYAFAVDLEMSWEFCSFGVVLTAAGYFLALRQVAADGAFYRRVVRPLAEVSYGTYLAHMFVLTPVMDRLVGRVAVPAAIFGGALAAFIVASLFSLLVRRIPRIGPLLVG